MADKCQGLADRLWHLASEGEATVATEQWGDRARSFVRAAFDSAHVQDFSLLQSHSARVGFIQGLAAKLEADAAQPAVMPPDGAPSPGHALPPGPSTSRDVFIVHGHDSETKERVARFVEKLGLNAVVLHERPNGGRTLIEKFEACASHIAFAVILLTPDDLGGPAADRPRQAPRARQNVILELGYFFGKLGRSRVCALHERSVELPSDIHGLVYVPLDENWKTRLAQEFVEAKLPINVAALLGA